MADFDPRELEWQRRYEQNDTPWDKGEAAPALVRYLKENPVIGDVLVPGCGRGHEVRALALQPSTSVVGLDLSSTALAEARRLSVDASKTARFIEGDFFNLPSEMIGAFGWLVEHTCFCAIEPRRRQDYVSSAFSALRAGGRIFGIFYLNPDTDGGPPFAVSRQELIDLFTPHFTVLQEWVPAESFPGRENRELVLVLQRR